MAQLGEFKRHKIGDAARMLEIKPYVLRFWETEFAELDPIRTPSGQRLYTDEHLELLRRIKALLYGEGLTIEGARKRLGEDNPLDFLREVEDSLKNILAQLNGDDAAFCKERDANESD